MNLADLWFLKINMSTAFDYRMQSSSSSFQQSGNYKFRHVPCSSYFSTIHLHAIFMFVGWILLVNLSTIISKYVVDPNQPEKQKYYRSLSRVLMVNGGFIFIY